MFRIILPVKFSSACVIVNEAFFDALRIPIRLGMRHHSQFHTLWTPSKTFRISASQTPTFWTAASPLLKILNIAAIIKFSNPFSAAVVHNRHTITIQAPCCNKSKSRPVPVCYILSDCFLTRLPLWTFTEILFLCSTVFILFFSTPASIIYFIEVF